MTDDKLSNTELCECIERIVKRYESETFIFLDCVLTNDPDDPEYSANTVYLCLENIVTFQRLYFGADVLDVPDFLRKSGYSEEDIALRDKQRGKVQ